MAPHSSCTWQERRPSIGQKRKSLRGGWFGEIKLLRRNALLVLKLNFSSLSFAEGFFFSLYVINECGNSLKFFFSNFLVLGNYISWNIPEISAGTEFGFTKKKGGGVVLKGLNVMYDVKKYTL